MRLRALLCAAALAAAPAGLPLAAAAATISPDSNLVHRGVHDLSDGPFRFALGADGTDGPGKYIFKLRADSPSRVRARLALHEEAGRFAHFRVAFREGDRIGLSGVLGEHLWMGAPIPDSDISKIVVQWSDVTGEGARFALDVSRDERAEVAPVPLPAAGGLLAAALVGTGLIARRRRRAA
jgi:hypothetical protein